jgi:hypothetical protein
MAGARAGASTIQREIFPRFQPAHRGASSDEFYSYKMPSDFRLEKREVRVFSTREVPDPKLEAKVKGTRRSFFVSLRR